MLGSRASPFIQGSHKYVNTHVEQLKDIYDENTNPHGCILMSIAENKLCSDILLHRIQNHKQLSPSILTYTDTIGTSSFRSVLSQFLSSYIFKECNINPDHIIVSAG